MFFWEKNSSYKIFVKLNFEVFFNVTQDGTELTLRTASKHDIRFFERWILNGFFKVFVWYIKFF